MNVMRDNRHDWANVDQIHIPCKASQFKRSNNGLSFRWTHKHISKHFLEAISDNLNLSCQSNSI